MKNFFAYSLISFTLLSSFLFLMPANALTDAREQIMGQIEAGAQSAELGVGRDPRLVAATLIKVFLGLLGVIFMILVFMGGYWLITARGEEEKVKKAQDTIKRAVIGLMVILLSYAIVNYISSGIERAVYGG